MGGRRATAPRTLLLAVGAAIVVVLVAAGTVAESAAGAAVVAVSVTSVVVGLRRNVRPSGLRWSLSACAVLFAVGFVIRAVAPVDSAASTVADVCSFTGYALLATFLVGVVRRTRAHLGALMLMDASVATLGLAIVTWTLLISPSLTADAPEAYRILNAAYVGADLMLLALAVQLTLRHVARVPAFWYLMLGLSCLLVGDLGYAAEAVDLLSVPDRLLAVWHLASFGLLGAMTLDRSVRALFVPAPPASLGVQRGRAIVLFVSLLTPTVLLALLSSSGRLDFAIRVVAYVSLVTLVFLRTWLTAVRLDESRAQVRHQADHDGLTGVLSRAKLLEVMRQRVGGPGPPLHVLFVDVDGFKAVNDAWGHPVGDAVLAQAARRIETAAGGRVVGRVGGDEFVVLSEDDDPLLVAARVRAGFTAPFELAEHGPVALGCSIGVATAGAGATLEQVVADADIAMYAVKAAAGSGVRVFDPAMRTALTERAETRQALVHALERDELSIHLQPLFAAHRTDAPAGFEALLRWDRPGRGLVPPNEFVPVAEEFHLLVPIGHRVLRDACEQTVRLRHALGDDLFVTVNLSAGQLQDPELEDAVVAALTSSGLPAESLWLEITETTMIEDVDAARATIAALRARGVRFALDDFGTGFTSLSYLHDIDCQVVKIDRSFVARLDAPVSSEPVVHAIVAVAHALGMTVVAEGVETPCQAHRLAVLGVEHLQGFLLGRPQPVDALLSGVEETSVPRPSLQN